MWEKANTDDCRWLGETSLRTETFKLYNRCIVPLCLPLFWQIQRKNVCWSIRRLYLRKRCRGNSIAPPETLCFDSSQSAVERTPVVYVFVAVSRIEIQASRGSPGWPVELPWASAKNGGERSIRGISSDQISSLIYTGNTEHGNPPGGQDWSLMWKCGDKVWFRRTHARHLGYSNENKMRKNKICTFQHERSGHSLMSKRQTEAARYLWTKIKMKNGWVL